MRECYLRRRWAQSRGYSRNAAASQWRDAGMMGLDGIVGETGILAKTPHLHDATRCLKPGYGPEPRLHSGQQRCPHDGYESARQLVVPRGGGRARRASGSWGGGSGERGVPLELGPLPCLWRRLCRGLVSDLHDQTHTIQRNILFLDLATGTHAPARCT